MHHLCSELRSDGISDLIVFVIFSPDDRRLTSCSFDGEVKLRNAQDGTCKRTIYGYTLESQLASYSCDDGRFVQSSADGKIDLFHPLTGKCLHHLESDGGELKMVNVLSKPTIFK